MRSASLSYVQQAVKEKWRQRTKINKQIKEAKKSTAARYLQLKSGHAITGVHLLRIKKSKTPVADGVATADRPLPTSY
jgi:hypothetical protein